jgi:hypothetical protein
MSRVNVKSGTPVGNDHLCRSCSNGQYTVGYRESDVLTICTNASPSRVLPFTVRECTDYQDRNRPDWEQMQKLALALNETRRKPIRGFSGNGFSRVPVIVADEDENENGDGDEAEVALVCNKRQ